MTSLKQPMFLNQINMLQSSSKETVVHANVFTAFPKYMHTPRSIEGKVVRMIEQLAQKPVKQLILLSGSVGDGKSHLLSYLKAKYENIFEQIDVHNDATESHDPQQSSIETLEKILQGFNDGQVAEKHAIIAINVGVLHNFCQKQEENQQFQVLRQFIEESGIFNEKQNEALHHEQFQLFNFASERIFMITNNGASSPFLAEILRKVVKNHPENPIYKGWQADMENGFCTMAHLNYQMLQNESVQERVLEKLYHAMLRDKILLSTRAFYHFIFTIIVPSVQELDSNKTAFGIQNTLPNLLFNHPERSMLLDHLYRIDPLYLRNRETDECVTNLHILMDKWTYVSSFLSEDTDNGVVDVYEVILKHAIANENILEVAQFIIRMKDLLQPTIYQTYHEFVKYLYSYYRGESKVLAELFGILSDAFTMWKGSPQKDFYYVTNDVTRDYRVAIPLKLKPKVGSAFGVMMQNENVLQYENYVTVGFGQYNFELDLNLYELLKRVQGGYRPNIADLNNAIQFEDFYKQLMSHVEEESEELLIVRAKTQMKYLVSRPSFSLGDEKYKVEKVN